MYIVFHIVLCHYFRLYIFVVHVFPLILCTYSFCHHIIPLFVVLNSFVCYIEPLGFDGSQIDCDSLGFDGSQIDCDSLGFDGSQIDCDSLGFDGSQIDCDSLGFDGSQIDCDSDSDSAAALQAVCADPSLGYTVPVTRTSNSQSYDTWARMHHKVVRHYFQSCQ